MKPFAIYGYILFLLFIALSCRNNKAKSKELVFWCSNNNQEIKLCTGITDHWNQQHPSVLVHMQPIPEGQSSEEVILAAVVGKSAPDINANMWQGNVEMYARAGVLIPLDTLKGFMDFLRDRCDSNVIKEITSSDGHIYQMPWKVNPIMTIYNKDIFKENQLTTIPKTYSDYLKAAAIFQQNNQHSSEQKYFGYTAVKSIWYERLFNYYTLYLAASGGLPLVKDNKAFFNNKYSVAVFRFLQTLYNRHFFSRENAMASGDPFVMQTIATNWTGPWEISYLNSIPTRKFNYDFFTPIVPDGHTGPVYTYADPKNIVLFNTCSDPQHAWEFIKTIVDKPGDLQLLEVTGQLPRRRNLETDTFYTEYFKQNPMMVSFARQIPYVKGVDNCEVIVEVLDIISQEYEACVIYGRKTPEEAIEDAADAVNVLLGKEVK